MRYDVSHRTHYRYSRAVSISHHLLHLSPRQSDHQRVERSSVVVTPPPAAASEATDYFGNAIQLLTIEEQHEELVFNARSVIEVTAPQIPDASATPAWNSVYPQLAQVGDRERLEILQYAFASPQTASTLDLAGYAAPSFPPGRPLLEAALDLTARIYNEFTYDGSATTVTTPLDDLMGLRRGVCQDFAHLQIACLRALGLPARYVSGYLRTYPPEGQKKLVGADASHAWCSLWVPGCGWIDLDPTNNLIPGDEHITLAWGRDYGDVSPINGVIFGGGPHVIEVAVDVTPLPG